MGSSPFGVSIILITGASRGSRMMRRNGSGPIVPSPIHWWRSSRDPSPPLESLRCKHLRCVSPTSRSNRSHTSSRSEEHTSELQSQSNLVCRLLLEKKKKGRQILPEALPEVLGHW